MALTWKSVTNKKSCPEGIFSCTCCKKETLMHPNYIKEGIAVCLYTQCKGRGTVEAFAKAMCKLRNWIFKKLITEDVHKPKVELECDGGHELTLDFQNLRKGCICRECVDRTSTKIKGKKEPEKCNCKELKLGHYAGPCYICEHNNHNVLYPDSASEWDYNKNNNISPKSIAPTASGKFWFICRNEICKMSYDQILSDRAYEGARCPYCAGQKVCHWNCLATTHPELCKELSPNNTIKATEITHGSGLTLLWLCDKHDESFEYPASPGTRIGLDRGCPKCQKGYEQSTGGHEFFVAEANRVHNNKYKYPEQYKGIDTKIDIDCPIHSLFKQYPSWHKKGRGCPECAYAEIDSLSIRIIKTILHNSNINHIPEKKFDELRYVDPLRIDIFIMPNIAIEYDGKQHFKPNETWGGEEALVETKKRDLTKDIFCVKNKINLWRIPYNVTPTPELLNKIIRLCSTGRQYYSSYGYYLKDVAKCCDMKDIIITVIKAPV